MSKRVVILLGLMIVWSCTPESTDAVAWELESRDEASRAEESSGPTTRPELTHRAERTEGGDKAVTMQGVYRIENATPQLPSPEQVGIEWSEESAVDLRPPMHIEPPTRERRRMNIDQLQAAFIRVSDGLNWTERRGNVDVSLFDELSVTLGKPDFIQTTAEVLEPTALFQKFLDDAGRQVCEKMMARDTASPTKVLLPANDDHDTINAHLARLVLQFHSRTLDVDSRDLAQWRWLYDTVAVVEDSREIRWQTVCVALFTHPDFYRY